MNVFEWLVDLVQADCAPVPVLFVLQMAIFVVARSEKWPMQVHLVVENLDLYLPISFPLEDHEADLEKAQPAGFPRSLGGQSTVGCFAQHTLPLSCQSMCSSVPWNFRGLKKEKVMRCRQKNSEAKQRGLEKVQAH